MKLEVEYKRYEEKPKAIDRIIESLKKIEKSLEHFWLSYDTINFKLENGNVEIKVEKYFVQEIGNDKIEVFITSNTYVFKENSEIVKSYWKQEFYVARNYEDVEDFKEYFSETYFWRNKLDNIFRNNNYFYETFEEIFYPELDLRKE